MIGYFTVFLHASSLRALLLDTGESSGSPGRFLGVRTGVDGLERIGSAGELLNSLRSLVSRLVVMSVSPRRVSGEVVDPMPLVGADTVGDV